LIVAGGVLVWALGGHATISAAAGDDMKPGLEVCYIYQLIRHIDEIAELEKQKECKPGEPLAALNSRVGLGKVLTSEHDDGVIAKINGFIHLDKPGTYAFTFESNDGVRLEIDGEMVLEDPDVHSDRYSEIGHVEVTEPGWHPLSIQYFERKNTSTLRFYWSPPGTEGTMPMVPAEALAH
jgi:hypothetical protein